MVASTHPDNPVADDAKVADSDERYREAVRLFEPALVRLARAYEAHAELRRDLLQDIHVALWRSFRTFDGRCSLRTWVFRVAHITATKHIAAHRRLRLRELQTLDEVPEPPAENDQSLATDEDDARHRLMTLIQQLNPVDRQVILLYLEDFTATAIAELVGLRPENVATKIHRIKKLLAAMFKGASES
jgi:RNA polymerase sigma-70 factor (ECF subfamily)